MFVRQATRAVKAAAFKPVGVRPISQYVEKASGYLNQAIYWGKVTIELGKQIYVKEGLAPPNVAEIQSVYQSLYKQALGFAAKPKASFDSSVSYVKSLSKEETLRYGAYFIQIVGLFSLGEIIGRRQLVGYPTFGPKTEHH